MQVSHSDFLYNKFVLREEQSQSLRKKSQSQHTGSKSKLEFHTGDPSLVIVMLLIFLQFQNREGITLGEIRIRLTSQEMLKVSRTS